MNDYNYIDDGSEEFQKLYKEHRTNPDFKLAGLPDVEPHRGFCLFYGDDIVGIGVTTLLENCTIATIEEPFWAFSEYHRDYGVKFTEEWLSKRKNITLLGNIIKDGHREHKAALVASKSIGFHVADQDDERYIVKRVL